MILIPRTAFIIIVLVIIGGVVGLGYFGYTTEPGSAGEWILYWHICAAALIAFVFGLLLMRSLRIIRHMDNLITMSKHRGFSPDASMRKLGKIGEKITLLYFELQSLSDKKSLKIGLQRDLIEFLVGIVREELLVTDVTGTVLFVSRSFTESIPGGKAEHVGKELADLVSGVAFQSVVSDLNRRHMTTELEIENRTVLFHPVFNRRGELGYVVVSFEKLRMAPASLATKTQNYEKNSMQNRFRKILGRSTRK